LLLLKNQIFICALVLGSGQDINSSFSIASVFASFFLSLFALVAAAVVVGAGNECPISSLSPKSVPYKDSLL